MMTVELNARTLMLLGAAAALLGCNQEKAVAKDDAKAATVEPTAAAAAVAPAAAANVSSSTAPATSAALSADYMVGKWSAMGEDCSATIEFRKNGTVNTPIGEGKWTLAGDKLSFDYADGSKQQPSTIKALAADRIEITTSSGRKETEKRC